MNKDLTPLEAFNRFKMLVKPDIISDECLELKEIIETNLEDYERLLKMRKTAEWADEKLQTKNKLKALETIKEYFILVSEYGKISFELKKEIPEDKYDLLKEVLE